MFFSVTFLAPHMACQPERTKAYDDDLRWRMVYQRYALDLPYRDISKNLNVDPSTVCRIIQRFDETGSVSKATFPRGHEHPHQKLRPTDEFLILQLVLDKPGVYLDEIRKELYQTTGTDVSVSTICNFLHRNGFTRTRLKQVALQQSEELRAKFRSDISVYPPEMLVFLDETGSDRRDAMRKFGYSLRGKPAKAHRLLFRGNHVTAIAAMSLEGMFPSKFVQGGVDAERFMEFADTCLLPNLMPFNGVNPKSVVIMDNASIHHTEEVVSAIENIGVMVHFLPPYSPDMNPIEMAFSKAKAIAKANEPALEAGMDIETLILTGFASITTDDCKGWISHAGYKVE